MSNTIREILFRGKILNIGPMSVSTSDEWVYGFYVKDTICTYIYSTLYCPKMVNVAPETVGQFTGLTDKNGNKIFEGDIVKHRVMYSEGKAIKFEDQIFTVRYSVEQARFLAYLPNGVFNPVAMQDCEVVGNIHDNELLEESNA